MDWSICKLRAADAAATEQAVTLFFLPGFDLVSLHCHRPAGC